MVVIRATSENKLSNTEKRGSYKETTIYRLPSPIRDRLKSWRVKRRYHFRRFNGVHWEMLRVWFFPMSERFNVEKWLEKEYVPEYYEIREDIPEKFRGEFKISVEYGEFLPIQPESSRIIARMVQEAVDEMRHDVDRLRANVEDARVYVEEVKRWEAEIAERISRLNTSSPVLSWSKESIMLFANILALSNSSNLDAAVCRRLKANVAKLRGIISPFDQKFKAVLDLAHNSISIDDWNQTHKGIRQIKGSDSQTRTVRQPKRQVIC